MKVSFWGLIGVSHKLSLCPSPNLLPLHSLLPFSPLSSFSLIPSPHLSFSIYQHPEHTPFAVCLSDCIYHKPTGKIRLSQCLEVLGYSFSETPGVPQLFPLTPTSRSVLITNQTHSSSCCLNLGNDCSFACLLRWVPSCQCESIPFWHA